MRKTILIGALVLVGVALLAGAAFLGARLLSPRQAANGPNGNNSEMITGRGPGKNISIERKPAEELPDRDPDINGEVTEVKDNSLMVTPVGDIRVTVNQDGETSKDVEYLGAAMEVVVTQETKVYLDVTNREHPLEEATGESMVIEQALEDAELSQIGAGGLVTVWGYKRGDRLIAETVVLEILPQ